MKSAKFLIAFVMVLSVALFGGNAQADDSTLQFPAGTRFEIEFQNGDVFSAVTQNTADDPLTEGDDAQAFPYGLYDSHTGSSEYQTGSDRDFATLAVTVYTVDGEEVRYVGMLLTNPYMGTIQFR